ncbi:MAG: Wzz/FepE/Etk N-terminal domain-containing protein [Clostridiales bacterium]|nr:Wzz/FepE/Etk N-terminal domain-containing protein [Clostridiales bacterium]
MDLQDIVRIFRKWRVIIIITPILTTIAAGFYYFQIVLPVYTSSSRVLLFHQRSEEILIGTDLVTSSNLINDYCVFVKTTPILEETAERLEVALNQVQSCSISVTKVSDTRVVNISVSSSNPELAEKVVVALTAISSEKAKDVLQTDNIRVIEPASAARKTGPASLRNTAIGFAVGLALAVAFSLLVEMLNTTVRSPDDVEKYLKMPVLAQIPRYGE